MGVITTAAKAAYDALVSGATQAIRKDGSVAFSAAQAGVDPTTAASLATRAYSDLGGIVVVAAMTTAALPAYTTSGGPGVGFTITATSNGAFPVLDGIAAVTAAASGEPVSARFLLHNGAASSDNRVFVLTQQGDGSHPYIAVAYTGLDTAAKMAGSQLRVQSGLQSAGTEYIFRPVTAPTLGTSAIFWWPTEPKGHSPNEYVELCNTDFQWGDVNLTATSSVTEGFKVSGTTAAAVLALASNTTTRRGVVQLTTGTTTTGTGWLRHTGAVFCGADDGWQVEWKGGLPVLSDGTNTFSVFIGFTDSTTASPTNCVALTFQPLINTTKWQLTLATAGTPANNDTTVVISAGVDDHIIMRKDPGDPNIYLFINGVLVVTSSAGVPTTAPLALSMQILKSAGTTARLFEQDLLRAYAYTPRRRAA